ncbi:MAG: pilus assembly protein [Dehalococcoidia bacterium]|nr:pilus assembly protein [Dehalococcoidia bacterium]MCA9824300.1 pilus assembly protein [Dehalococcoidia bacterium]MCA9845040.1 pilus assembly protein [Dehalococcoidia bacterium]
MDKLTTAAGTGHPRAFARAGRWLRRQRSEKGQALVEFAMIVPLLCLMLFSLVDFGRAFYAWLLVTNAAREGARVAATQQDSAAVLNRIDNSISGLNAADLSITLTNVQGPRGQAVEVDLVYDFQFVSPIGDILNFITGGSISDPTITSHSSMRLE